LKKKTNALDEAMRCSQEQANELVRLLQHALEQRMNVIVHCHAGVCRSGAVCEIGVMLGFDDTEVFRSPNLLGQASYDEALGWTYDEQEPHSINGVTTAVWHYPSKRNRVDQRQRKGLYVLAAERRARREKKVMYD
jgi:hypothetical protein